MKVTILLFSVILLISCQNDKASLVILNGDLYTVDENQPQAEAIAIKDESIVKVGSNETINKWIGPNTQVIDAKNAFVMPGFIEGHGHFSGLGMSLLNLNFLNSKNWDEVVEMVAQRASELPPGAWIEGRGWHQEKWDKVPLTNYHGYPDHYSLSEVSPDNPVILYHASGHGLFANAAAMEAAGVNKETSDPVGGAIIRDGDGEAIGVFEERAMSLIRAAHQEYLNGLSQEERDKKWYEAISLAEAECLSKGVTSFQDAGSKFFELDRYETLAKEGELDLRLWAMVRHSADEMEGKLKDYKMVGVGNHFYTCNAIKSEVDGALGAFGAWLLEPYSDKPGFTGQNTTDIYEVKSIAELAQKNDMQFCVHAIGDRANRVVVDLFESMLSKTEDPKSKRWRIEHAQHLDPADIPRFAKNGIIASMQGIHCTSDAPFVEKRLGPNRSKLGAYAWRSLLDNGVVVANGTDAPVEDVNPIYSFYASVTRKRADTGFEFYPEQSMTREEAIYSYTLGNAYAAFEESIKGSLTPGKVGDLVILDQNLVTCDEEDILGAKVLLTLVDGEVKYASGDFSGIFTQKGEG